MKSLREMKRLLDMAKYSNDPQDELDDETMEAYEKEIERYEAHAEEMADAKRKGE